MSLTKKPSGLFWSPQGETAGDQSTSRSMQCNTGVRRFVDKPRRRPSAFSTRPRGSAA
jgi:hypothetical protein